MRFTTDYAYAAEHDGLFVDDHGLHAATPSASSLALVDNQIPILVMSATPPLELREMVDLTVDVPIDQGVAMTLFPRHSWGKTGLKSHPLSSKVRTKHVQKFKVAGTAELGEDLWLTTHLATELDSGDDLVDLHYGNHRGTNDFEGRPGLIIGSHRPAPQVERENWELAAFLAKIAGGDPAFWHEWNGDRADPGDLIEVNPGLFVPSTTRRYIDPAIRAWNEYNIAAHTAQVAGRARGHQHILAGGDPLPVWLAASPQDLGQFGIRVVAVRKDPPDVAGRGGLTWNQFQALDSDHRAQIGVGIARQSGIKPTRDAVMAILVDFKLKTISPRNWQRMRAAGLLDGATDPEIEKEIGLLCELAEERADAVAAAAAAIIITYPDDAPEPKPVTDPKPERVRRALVAIVTERLEEPSPHRSRASDVALNILGVSLGLAPIAHLLL
jgi:hypothetical protein